MRHPRIVGLRVQLGLAIVLALAVVSTAAQAQILAAVLDGLQENPSISTNAFGTFIAVIADDEQSINVVLNYNPL